MNLWPEKKLHDCQDCKFSLPVEASEACACFNMWPNSHIDTELLLVLLRRPSPIALPAADSPGAKESGPGTARSHLTAALKGRGTTGL